MMSWLRLVIAVLILLCVPFEFLDAAQTYPAESFDAASFFNPAHHIVMPWWLHDVVALGLLVMADQQLTRWRAGR